MGAVPVSDLFYFSFFFNCFFSFRNIYNASSLSASSDIFIVSSSVSISTSSYYTSASILAPVTSLVTSASRIAISLKGLTISLVLQSLIRTVSSSALVASITSTALSDITMFPSQFRINASIYSVASVVASASVIVSSSVTSSVSVTISASLTASAMFVAHRVSIASSVTYKTKIANSIEFLIGSVYGYIFAPASSSVASLGSLVISEIASYSITISASSSTSSSSSSSSKFLAASIVLSVASDTVSIDSIFIYNMAIFILYIASSVATILGLVMFYFYIISSMIIPYIWTKGVLYREIVCIDPISDALSEELYFSFSFSTSSSAVPISFPVYSYLTSSSSFCISFMLPYSASFTAVVFDMILCFFTLFVIYINLANLFNFKKSVTLLHKKLYSFFS